MHRSRFGWTIAIAALFGCSGTLLMAQNLGETNLIISEEAAMERAIDGDLPATDDDELMDLLGGLDEGPAASEAVVVDTPDLDALLDGAPVELPAEEKGTSLDDLFGEDAPVVEDATAAPVDDFDALFQELDDTVKPADPVVDPAPAMDDLAGILGDPAPIAEEPVAVDDLAGLLDDPAPAPVADPMDDLAGLMDDPAPIAEEPAAGDDLADLLGDPVAEPAPLPLEAAPIPEAPVQIVDEPRVRDQRALDDGLLDQMLQAGVDEASAAPPPMIVRPPTPRSVPVVALEPPLDPDVQAAMTQEALKRQAQEAHGLDSLKAGDTAMKGRNFESAIKRYLQALQYLPSHDVAERKEAREGVGAAYYHHALQYERMGGADELEKALASAINAVDNGYLRAEGAVRRIKEKQEGGPVHVPRPKDKWWETDEYVQTENEVELWMKRGREAYLAGQYERSIRQFESVLARDPSKKEAVRLMRRASQKLYDRSSMELEATRTRLSQQVRASWNPRDYGIYETPVDKIDGDSTGPEKNETSIELRILRKLEQIRLPEVDFRQANIRDVVGHFSTESRANDPEPNDKGPKGVNFVLDLGDDAPGAAPAGGGDAFGGGASDDPFATDTADPFAMEGAAGALPSGEAMITFSALDISLKEALSIVCDLGRLKYRVRGSVVMIVPLDKPDGDIGMRMYDVLPSLITKLTEIQEAVAQPAAGGFGGGGMGTLESRGAGRGPQEDLKVVFDRLGVKWPTGSSIQHIPAIGKLVVANTPENLTEFERILAVLNVVPFQIEIESRFVEVAQTDLDSLGLEWLLTDDWELARKAGSGPTPGSEERLMIRQNAQNGGFTTGNRYLSNDGPGTDNVADQLFAMSSVLTNPELTVVLHALQQSGHTDLLSAPKITTQSGQEATLKVVTEYIYPTEFETSGITSGGNQNLGGNDNNSSTIGAVVTPSAFETREVGVILSVLPEVTPEGSMINLTMSPVVVSEPTWKNYGSSYTSYDPNGNPIVQELNMEQPFFHKRELTTSMLIYNGATVVMGGMITEIRTDIDDRVPILGDIPIIGNLFRSRYERSEKRNLLIFVSARLVDPAGRPLDSQQMSGGMSSLASSMSGNAPE